MKMSSAYVPNPENGVLKLKGALYGLNRVAMHGGEFTLRSGFQQYVMFP